MSEHVLTVREALQRAYAAESPACFATLKSTASNNTKRRTDIWIMKVPSSKKA